jgi:hypothetical protein
VLSDVVLKNKKEKEAAFRTQVLPTTSKENKEKEVTKLTKFNKEENRVKIWMRFNK